MKYRIVIFSVFVAIGDCMMAQEVRHIDMGLSVFKCTCSVSLHV